MALISVIVPVYNAEKYLHRCIDSILAQTFTDLELLLIDDGSTDSSGKICDEYAVKDERIRVFHKENGGVSSARNMGLDNAKGEWIAFVDADDWVDKIYLMDLIRHSNYDLVISYYQAVGWVEWKAIPYKEESFEKKQMTIFLSKYLISCNMPWSKLFTRHIIDSANLRFDLNIGYGEDTLFVMDYLQYVNSVAVSAGQYYQYNCLNNNSLSSKVYDIDFYLLLIDKIAKRISDLSIKFNSDISTLQVEILRLFTNRLFESINYEASDAILQIKKICKNSNVQKVIQQNDLKISLKKRLFHQLLRLKQYNLVIHLMVLRKRFVNQI